jgi:hypothetical protein
MVISVDVRRPVGASQYPVALNRLCSDIAPVRRGFGRCPRVQPIAGSSCNPNAVMSEPSRTSSLDVGFVTRWSPARFAMAGIVGYAVLLFVSPLEYDYSLITVSGTAYAVAVFLGFFGGCQIGRVLFLGSTSDGPRPVTVSPDRFINVAIVIGTLGVAARVFDRFVLRGFSIGATYMENRESIAETVSVFGYIGGMCFSFGAISLFLVWVSGSQQRRPVVFVLAALLTFYPALEALLSGSRSTLLHVVFLGFFFARSTNALPWLIRSRVAMLVCGLALMAFVELIYEIRSLEGDDEIIDISDIFRLTAIGQYARPPQWITDAIISTNGQGLVAGSLKVWTHFVQYLTHSWLVYFVNFDQFQDVLGWGRLHLYLPTRTLSALVGEDLSYDPGLYGMELGVSPTAISLVYYDFGGAGPLFAILFGMAVTVVHRKAIRIPERWLPLNAYLCFACLTIMIDNQLIGALGAFAIWTFIAYIPLHYVMSLLSLHSTDLVEGEDKTSGAGGAEDLQTRTR